MADYTIDQIAKHLDITRERVRQIEASAIKKLKHPKLQKVLLKIIEEELFEDMPECLEKYGDRPRVYVKEGEEFVGDVRYRLPIHRDN